MKPCSDATLPHQDYQKQRTQRRVTFVTDLPHKNTKPGVRRPSGQATLSKSNDGSDALPTTLKADPPYNDKTLRARTQPMLELITPISLPSLATCRFTVDGEPFEPRDQHHFPLSYHNDDSSAYNNSEPVQRGRGQHKKVPLDPEWHSDCPFDNIAHGRPTPEDIAPRSGACHCYTQQHGIILINKTLTHGEGGPYRSLYEAPVCVICFEQLPYTAVRTLTHRVPYYAGPCTDHTSKVASHCGSICHLECAADYIKRNLEPVRGTTLPCPGGCGNDWIVSLDLRTRAGVMLKAASSNVKKSIGN